MLVGRFHDIHESARIADSARICNFVYIGQDVEIGEGTVIGNFCEINSGAKIGRNNMINSHCHVNSDTVIGNDNIFGASVLTADEKHMTARTKNITKTPCVIGNDCRIGQHSSLVCTKLGNHVSIGAGSTVLAPEIPDRQVWAGTPARYLRDISDSELAI